MHHRCLYISHPSSEGIPSPTQEYNLTYSKPAPPQAFLLCLLVPIPLLLDNILPDDRQAHQIQHRRAVGVGLRCGRVAAADEVQVAAVAVGCALLGWGALGKLARGVVAGACLP